MENMSTMFKKSGVAAASAGLGDNSGEASTENAMHAWLNTLIVGLIIVCTLVTAGAMFSGFVSMGDSGPIELGLSALFTLVVAAGIAICAMLMFVAKRRSLQLMFFSVWAFAASISVTMGFGLYYDMTSASTAARIDIRAAVREAVVPLTTVQSAMQRTSQSADAVATYSEEQARIETVKGGTCDNVAIAAPGPRRDLRLRDAASFREAATELRSRAAEFAKQASSAQDIALTYDPARHAHAVSALDRAFSQVRALSDDGVLSGWRSKVRARIAAADKPVVTEKGGQFFCRDPGLVQRLRDASAIKMPALPNEPPAITEPTHAESVRRGLALATFQRPFDLRLDLLPLMLGVTLDVMILLFSGAHAVLNGYSIGPEDSDGDGGFPSPFLGLLRIIRLIPADVVNFIEMVDESLIENPSPTLAVYDKFCVERDAYDYLVVRQTGGSTEDDVLRAFVLLLRQEAGVKLHWTGPVATLPDRIRGDLKVRLPDTVRVALYEIKRETISRYRLAKLASVMRSRNGAANTGQPPLKVIQTKHAGA